MQNPHLKTLDEFKSMYEESINNPKNFFSKMAKGYFQRC